jgi:tetratricopeptide (TPR) repeat protein
MGSTTDVTSVEFAAAVNRHISSGLVALDPSDSTHRTDRTSEALRLLGMATDFCENGWPDKARRFARRALAILERESGTEHPEVVRVLLCLARAREDGGDHARAEEEYRRANEILGRIGDDSNNLEAQRLRIQTTRGLAKVTRALGRDSEAETMLKDALAMAEGTFGWKHPDVAGVLNDLGAHYRHTRDSEKALRVYRRALAITEETLGPEHPQAAAILHDLAVLEHARGQFAAGEPFARRAVSIREKTLGADHPQVAADVVAMAALLEGQGKYDEAEPLYRRALMAYGHWFGPDHHEVAATANHLARVFDRAIDQRLMKRAGGDERCA